MLFFFISIHQNVWKMYPFSFHKNIKQHNNVDDDDDDDDDNNTFFLLYILIMRNTEDWSNGW